MCPFFYCGTKRSSCSPNWSYGIRLRDLAPEPYFCSSTCIKSWLLTEPELNYSDVRKPCRKAKNTVIVLITFWPSDKMTFSQFPFGNPYLAFQPEVPAFHGQSIFGDLESADSNFNDMAFTTEDALAQVLPACGHPPMQRFLNDNQRPLFSTRCRSQVLSAAQPVVPIPPVAFHTRQDSPFSSQDPSNCSSARSPRADTELYTENMPSTPPDNISFQPAPSDTFEPQPSFYLSGLTGESHPCVSMAQVNPADEFQTVWKDSPHALDFNSPQRSYTFESQASVSVDMDSISRHSSIDQGFHNCTSTPEVQIVVKEENRVSDHPSLAEDMKAPYPTPSVRDSEDSDAEIDVSTRSNEESDDDDEYRPNKKPTSASARRVGRGKRDAPARILEKGSPKKAKTASLVSPIARPIPPSTSGSKGSSFCTECSLPFKDEATFQAHVKKQHTRPFTCVFCWAGCTANFASKNEWKRHVMSQDIARTYYVCDLDACAHTKNILSPSKTSSGRAKRSRRGAGQQQKHSLLPEPVGPPLPNGAIFNRKDLFTQHVRRMHAPTNLQKPQKSSKKSPGISASASASSSSPSAADWEEQIKTLQSRALRERCELPTYMRCPAAPHCSAEFSGADAWDQRMEHVARHLENAALGDEEPVVFGGPTDPTLVEWATGPDVAVVRAVGPTGGQQWVLNNPLRAASEGRGVGRKRGPSQPSSLVNRGPGTGASLVAGGSLAMSIQLGSSRTEPSVKSEIVVEEGEEDAEGEEE